MCKFTNAWTLFRFLVKCIISVFVSVLTIGIQNSYILHVGYLPNLSDKVRCSEASRFSITKIWSGHAESLLFEMDVFRRACYTGSGFQAMQTCNARRLAGNFLFTDHSSNGICCWYKTFVVCIPVQAVRNSISVLILLGLVCILGSYCQQWGKQEIFMEGEFIQWHMVVICIWCALFVTSQFDVKFMFLNQRFCEVC